MKTTLIIALLLGTLSLQAQSIERQVIGSTGGTFSAGAIIITSTLGEVAVASQSSSSIILTEGYQQATDSNLISVKELETISEMVLYPNPTHTMSRLEITSSKNSVCMISIFSTEGKLINKNSLTLISGVQSSIDLDVSSYTSGIYYVRINETQGDFIKTIKLIKQ